MRIKAVVKNQKYQNYLIFYKIARWRFRSKGPSKTDSQRKLAPNTFPEKYMNKKNVVIILYLIEQK